MVSCDTPEKAGYAGKALVSQAKLNECRKRLENGFYDALPEPLRRYLLRKLLSDAAERHIGAGELASEVFSAMLERRLTLLDGSKRNTAIVPTGDIIDRYSRMLVYIAPWFADSKADPLPPKGDPARNTFNLDMIATGWAAFFPIYPSLPQNEDLNLAIAAAQIAWSEKRGAWKAFGTRLLLGYEYRMCIKLGTAKTAVAGIRAAFQRICVDLRSVKSVGKFGFHKAPPCYRLWVWQDDTQQASVDLGIAF